MKWNNFHPCKRRSNQEALVVEGLAVEVAVDSLVVVEAASTEAEVEVAEGFLAGEVVVIGLTGEIRPVAIEWTFYSRVPFLTNLRKMEREQSV
jgi:hypothetical protein